MSADATIELDLADRDYFGYGEGITQCLEFEIPNFSCVDHRFRMIDKTHGIGYYSCWGWYYDTRYDDVRRMIFGGYMNCNPVNLADHLAAYGGLYAGGANDYDYYLPGPENVPKVFVSKCRAYLTSLTEWEKDAGLRLYMEKAIDPDENRIEELRTGLGPDGKAHKPAKMPWEKGHRESKTRTRSKSKRRVRR